MGGGGGGGASSSSTSSSGTPSSGTPSSNTPSSNTPSSTPTCVSTSEGCLTTTQYRARVQSIRTTHRNNAAFSNQWGLDTINADDAWAKLQLKHGTGTAPGDGITLGAIDSGIDTSHRVFAGKTVTEVFLQNAPNEDGRSTSHGTAVAGVMVANPDQSFITQTRGARGVAWGADITMFAIPVGTGGGNFVPVSLSVLKYQDDPNRFPAIINAAVGWSNSGRSLDFVNASIGYSSIIDMYSKSDLTSNFG